MKDETLEAVGMIVKRLERARSALAHGQRQAEDAAHKIANNEEEIARLETELATLKATLKTELET